MEYLDTLKRYSDQPLTHQLLLSTLRSYQNPNHKIHRLVQEGILQSIKKGLYIAGPKLHIRKKPEPFLLANHILGPSYVSMESALAHYGFIPERVYAVTSMTTKAARKYETPAGVFSYTRLHLPYYSFGLRSVELAENQFALLASPEKAICDKIITTSGLLFRSKKSVREFLLENMRMDESKLVTLRTEDIHNWLSWTSKEESLMMLIKTLNEL